MAASSRSRFLIRARRELAWLLVGLTLGFVLIPWGLYQVGLRTLGPYEGAGAEALYAVLLGDFLHGHLGAWLLLLGPFLLLMVCRLSVKSLWGTRK